MTSSSFDFPRDILICPVCAASLTSTHCEGCNNDYFTLAGIPCVLPAGLQQKALWQHQMAMMNEQGAKALAHIDNQLQGFDVTAATRDRLELSYAAMEQSLHQIMQLLVDGGLNPEFDARFDQSDVDNPTEYYHHVLRDWAWDEQASEHFTSHANDANLQRVLSVWPDPKPGRMLVLGAGAGRLSWDLHATLNAELTFASDINPFLLASAQRLIKERQSFTLPELYTYPQIGYPYAKAWVMNPPSDEHNQHQQWFALGADVWNMPLKKHSVDTIVTSWLLDVTGGDIKDLISVIAYLLTPGGRWINTGPLLYSRNLSFDKKYSAQEILEFADLAGFELQGEAVDEIAHMVSPLNARYHHEQILSFNMLKRQEAPVPIKPSNTAAWLTPGWLVLHHLPIPKIAFECERGHEFIGRVLDLVDGERSVYLISQLVQSSLPEGVNAKEAVVALFGQVLAGMAAKVEAQ